MRPLATLAAVLVLPLGLVACGSDSGGSSASSAGAYGSGATSAPAGGTALSIKDFAFSPETLHVDKGATVKVTNDDTTSHTWTADDGTFDAGTMAPGKSATHTFDQAGSFSYHCEIHPNMKGTIEVG